MVTEKNLAEGESMNRNRVQALFLLFLAGGILLSGCGGGGESGMVSIPSSVVPALAWDPPQTYEDNTPLEPSKDLDCYEFYVRNDPNFTENDLPMAEVAAVEDVLSPDGKTYLKNLTCLFDLANLTPFLTPGARYYLSIRAVGMDGLKSGFSRPVSWDHTS
jgi:hypothetical protein